MKAKNIRKRENLAASLAIVSSMYRANTTFLPMQPAIFLVLCAFFEQALLRPQAYAANLQHILNVVPTALPSAGGRTATSHPWQAQQDGSLRASNQPQRLFQARFQCRSQPAARCQDWKKTVQICNTKAFNCEKSPIHHVWLAGQVDGALDFLLCAKLKKA